MHWWHQWLLIYCWQGFWRVNSVRVGGTCVEDTSLPVFVLLWLWIISFFHIPQVQASVVLWLLILLWTCWKRADASHSRNFGDVTASKVEWRKENFIRRVTVTEGCWFDLNSTVLFILQILGGLLELLKELYKCRYRIRKEEPLIRPDMLYGQETTTPTL